MIGNTVAQYRIAQRLGGGTMGMVYRAEDTRLERQVVLKFLPVELSGDAGAKERFLREARAASRLDHPNICPIYEFGETEDGHLYIVMPFYEGETLKQRLAGGPLATHEALETAWQIARALARAHSRGIVHRDVKPANVLITEDDEVKVLDFGLAKLADEAVLTRTGSSIGTPLYMSPEQIGGKTDARTDVWSLGVLLFEALTGQRPFGGGSPAAAMYHILHREPRKLAELRPDLAGELQSILDRALAKDPGERYPTMAEFAEDLAAAATAEGSATQPMLRLSTREPSAVVEAATADAVRREASRRRWRTAALAAAAVAIAAVALAPVIERRGPAGGRLPAATADAPRAVAVLPFTVRGAPELDYLREGMVDLLATKLDGAGDLRSVDPRALLGHLAGVGGESAEGGDRPFDPARAAGVGRHFEADLFILGNVVAVADQLRLDARLYRTEDPSAELTSATAEGPVDEIFVLVDRLAAQLLTARQKGPAARVSRLAAVTTESFPALKAYLEGESAYRDGRFEEARRAFRAAVDQDPGFALAWYRLAIVSEWLVDAEGAAEAARSAARHADRLAAHDRHLVEAFAAYSNGDDETAERLYRDVLDRHPDDIEAWSGLGETRFHYGPLHGRSRRGSRAAWQRAAALEPDDFNAQLHLARLDLYDQDFTALRQRLPRLEPLLAGTDHAGEVLFFRAHLPGGDAAREALAAGVRGRSLALGWMPGSFFSGSSWSDPELWLPAVEGLLAGERTPRERSYAHRLIGILQLALGRLETAGAELRQASPPPEMPGEYSVLAATVPFLPLPGERLEELRDMVAAWPLPEIGDAAEFSPIEPHALMVEHLRAYVLGLVAARLGDPAAALAHAAELTSLGELSFAPGLHLDLAAGVRAEVARLAGDSDEVLARLGERRGRYSYQLAVFSPVYSQVRERWLRAEALFDLGRLEEADGWYESLAELNLFDLTYLAWSHLRRGEIAHRLGRPEEARDHYGRFLRLWRDCDAELRPLLRGAEAAILASE